MLNQNCETNVPIYTYNPARSQSIIGKLSKSTTATIVVTDMDGNPISIISDVCEEVGDTGWFSWSLGNIPSVSEGNTQLAWVMVDSNSVAVNGSFILHCHEGLSEKVPGPQNLNDYIMKA